MPMPMHVGVTGAAITRVRISHNAQNARAIGLQHIENNHPNATARDSQSHILIGTAVPDTSPIERATGAARGHFRAQRSGARSGYGQALVGSAALAACSIFARWFAEQAASYSGKAVLGASVPAAPSSCSRRMS